MNRLLTILFVLISIAAINTGCRKNIIFTNNAVRLNFSTDTVFFDTIFSRLGSDPNLPRSVTLQVRVTNPTANAVKTNIRLAGNNYGIFKLNVDGKGGENFTDVEILGNDSIYIFAQAYIDRVNSFTPFIVTDQILFETNGNKQDVDIVAWAQDAHYYQDSIFDCATGNIFWSNDKPHVIYDNILIKKGCTLTIDAGAHIHSFVKSTFYVQGTLIVNGTTDNPVIFEGSRLDDDYKEVPGQWIGIRFLPGSINNKITGAIIKNGHIGIEIDSLPDNNNIGLILEQTIIKDMNAVGLLNYTGNLQATNNLIYNCGLYTFVGELGGTYDLKHNTMYMLNSSAGRKDPGFYLSNAAGRDENGTILYKFPLKYTLQNNIILGPLDDEFMVNIDAEGEPITNVLFEHNLLKTQNGNLAVNGNIINRDPLFKDLQKYDFEVRGNSICKNAGKNIGVFKDLKNRNRNTITPTIGAYEAQ